MKGIYSRKNLAGRKTGRKLEWLLPLGERRNEALQELHRGWIPGLQAEAHTGISL